MADLPKARSARSRLRALAVIAALTALVALPMQVNAHHLEGGMSVSIGGPIRLVSGVYLSVPVTYTCPALTEPLSALFSDEVFVNVTQKTTGKTFAFGNGGTFYQSPAANGVGIGSPVTCDGSAHTITVNVTPQIPDSGPFHGGRAVASANFVVTVYDPSTCVFCSAEENVASSPLQSISIH